MMTGHPRSVAPGNTLVEAAGLMRELDVGALPVLDGDSLAGLVTDRDIVVRGIADGRDPTTAQVREVMSGGIEFVSPDQDVEEAVRIMEKRQIRRLPVLDGAKRLVGMISLGDVAISSNPAFGGMALRDVSQPNEPSAPRSRLSRLSEPAVPPAAGARRGPGGGVRGRSGAQGSRMSRVSRQDPASAKRSDGAKSRRGSGKPATKAPSKRGKAKKM